MAPFTGANKQSANDMAAGGEFHNRKVNRGAGKGGSRSVALEQKQRIQELYATGKTGHEVAQIMGLGSTTVYNHLQLGRQKTPAWTDDEIQMLVDGYLEKLSPKEIAKKVGRSPRAVVIRMCRYRKEVRRDKKKQRALRAITWALKVVRKADIFKEVEH